MPQRVKFGTSSSMPPMVNFGAELRRISKSAAVANIEVLEEFPRAEWSFLYVVARNASASPWEAQKEDFIPTFKGRGH
jgi:hypothetical protein